MVINLLFSYLAALNWATSLITTQGYSGIAAVGQNEFILCPIFSLLSFVCFLKILHLSFFKKKVKQDHPQRYFERQSIVGTDYNIRRVRRDYSFKRTIMKKNQRSNKEVFEVPFFTRNFSKAFIDKLEAIVFKKEFEHEEIINQVIYVFPLFLPSHSFILFSSDPSSF